MPQYFTGLNPATAVSEGLLAGYEFVDRIRTRRRQLELQDRQLQLAENADQRAENADQRAQSEFDYTQGRRKVTDAREDRDDAFTVSERDRLVREREENENARRTLAETVLSGAPSSRPVGAGGAQRLTTAPASAPQITQTPDAPQNTQPAGPVDLRAAQRERDNAPGFVQRVSNFFNESAQKIERTSKEKFWARVANPEAEATLSGGAANRGVQEDLKDSPQNVRRNPAAYVERYIKERDTVPANARASLDLTMANALKEELASASPSRAKVINTQLGQLAKAATASAAADAGITRPVKVSDPRLVPAITDAAAKARAAQDILQTTPDELRAAGTMVARLGSAQRVNQKQVSAITTLYAHGLISTEELNNWAIYGTPIAPKRPTIQALGSGLGVMITDTSVSLIGLPNAGAGQNGLKPSEVRLREQNAVEYLTKSLGALVEQGELSDGSPFQHLNKLMQFLQREGGAVQVGPGETLVGPDGRVNLDKLNPGKLSEVVAAYEAYDKEEVKGVPFVPTAITRDNKTFSEYLPQGESIIDLTSRFQ